MAKDVGLPTAWWKKDVICSISLGLCRCHKYMGVLSARDAFVLQSTLLHAPLLLAACCAQGP